MKTRILLTIVTIGMIMSAMAQKATITLTFTADNNGQHMPLNSILIENLTQGGDTTLYAPDTVLVLDYVTGMNEVGSNSNNGFILSQNYPNPMKGKTIVRLWLPERNDILITISDIIGKEVVNQEFQLEQGTHLFTFYPGRESLYFLTVHANQICRTIKMFNSRGAVAFEGFCKLEYNSTKTGSGGYKARVMMNNFLFDLGDQLKYTASSVLGDQTLIDMPYGDQTYTFQYGSGGIPCPGMPTVIDIDGNQYNTVLIGTQCWMKENLKTTTFRDGTSIPNITGTNAWYLNTTGAYVWYDNDISWKDKYGTLYNWYATVNPNGLCPTGWHVPTYEEWTNLTDYIGGLNSPHGDELKSCRQVNSPQGGGCETSEHPRWEQHNTYYGTDDYGFSGLPGGARMISGGYLYLGNKGYWWTSTDIYSYAWYRYLNYDSDAVHGGYYSRRFGYSVRCLRD